MENNKVFDQEMSPTALTTESKAALASAAKWAKFLSIVDFVFWGQFILCLLLWVVNSSGIMKLVN